MLDRPDHVTATDAAVEQRAFQAWQRSGLGPDPIRMELLKDSWKTLACRLVGCGPGGGDVVATRRATETTLVEQAIYRDVLPGLSTPHLRLLGAMDDTDLGLTWMFLEDAGEAMPDLRYPEHRALAGRWLGRLHRELIGHSLREDLPDRSPAYVRGLLIANRAAMVEGLRNDHLDASGARLLRAAIRRLDAIDTAWPRVLGVMDDLPGSLVHGDFVRKNLRLRSGPDGPSIVAFDWEMSGWGPPLPDIGSVDLGAYLAEARPFWGSRLSSLDRFADVGRMLGLIVAISWEIPYLETPWLHRPMSRLAVYHARLGSALVRLGAAPTAGARRGPAALPSRPHGRTDGLAATAGVMRGLVTMEQRGVARVLGVVHREPNVYRSTFPSEIATCRFDDGVERRLFIKAYVPDIHDGFGYWRGGPYEARVYDDALARLGAGTPQLFGSWSDPATGQTFLALEYVAGLRLDRSPPERLVDAARWLGAFHRAGLPIAVTHPSMRRYDETFFRGWSARARASLRVLRPAARWVDRLVERFDDELVPRLLISAPAFIHGELYPENVIVAGGRICVVDWQSAAIGPGVIDVASLTEGHWPPLQAQEAVEAYVRARASEDDADIDAALEAARLYWAMRWLGGEPEGATVEGHLRYVGVLEAAAHRFGLIPGAR
jgi:aminoglycoside phosphotransferase (APT) family kinase protein